MVRNGSLSQEPHAQRLQIGALFDDDRSHGGSLTTMQTRSFAIDLLTT